MKDTENLSTLCKQIELYMTFLAPGGVYLGKLPPDWDKEMEATFRAWCAFKGYAISGIVSTPGGDIGVNKG
jgi:hypothetical protein